MASQKLRSMPRRKCPWGASCEFWTDLRHTTCMAEALSKAHALFIDFFA